MSFACKTLSCQFSFFPLPSQTLSPPMLAPSPLSLPLSSASSCSSRLRCRSFGILVALCLLWLLSHPVRPSLLLICRRAVGDAGVCVCEGLCMKAEGDAPAPIERRPAQGPAHGFSVCWASFCSKYVCYARRSADLISHPALIRARYLEGRPSASSNQGRFVPKSHRVYCSSQPVELLLGGMPSWVQGKVRGHAGCRDTEVN